jgi:hypothetical protein
MNFRNTVAGIIVGLVVVAFMKGDDAKHDSPNVTTVSATAIKVQTLDGTSANKSCAATAEPSTVVLSTAIESPPEPVKRKQQTLLAQRTLPSAEMFPMKPGRLTDLLRQSIAPARVSNPTPSEIDQFEQLFFHTLRSGTPENQLKLNWSELGWVLEAYESGGERFLAVQEAAGQRRGRGCYVIRVGSPSSLALQAPHRFYDTRTGLLTRKLFTENDVVVAAWNTVHREQVDLAHRSDHFINAMTRALIRWNTNIIVAQLHGFANEKQTGSARSASMIMSDSTAYPGRLVQRATAELKDSFGPQKVRLYPNEVAELGGTLNQQARVFHSMGRSGFLHIELSQPMREQLSSDASARARFFSALTFAASNRQDSRGR